MLPHGTLACKKCGKIFAANEIEVRTDRGFIELEAKKVVVDISLMCPSCKEESKFESHWATLPDGFKVNE